MPPTKAKTNINHLFVVKQSFLSLLRKLHLSRYYYSHCLHTLNASISYYSSIILQQISNNVEIHAATTTATVTATAATAKHGVGRFSSLLLLRVVAEEALAPTSLGQERTTTPETPTRRTISFVVVGGRVGGVGDGLSFGTEGLVSDGSDHRGVRRRGGGGVRVLRRRRRQHRRQYRTGSSREEGEEVQHYEHY